MTLSSFSAGRIAFNKVAVMGWAHREGRFALRMCRTLTERRAQLSLWLRKAWAAAKREAADLIRQAEQDAAARAYLTARAAEAVALVASYGGAAGLRQEIEAEHYRQHFDTTRVANLRAALAHVGA